MSVRNPCVYTIRAYWPNATCEPHITYAAHLADALNEVIRLARSGQHTTIRCTIDDLVVLTMWGQLEGLT
jgi:hypothetical protein